MALVGLNQGVLIGPALSGSLTFTADDEHSKDVDTIATAIASLHDRPPKKRPRAAEHANDGAPHSKRQCQDDPTGPLDIKQMHGYDERVEHAKTLIGLLGIKLPMSERGLKAKITRIYQGQNPPHAQQPYDPYRSVMRSVMRSVVCRVLIRKVTLKSVEHMKRLPTYVMHYPLCAGTHTHATACISLSPPCAPQPQLGLVKCSLPDYEEGFTPAVIWPFHIILSARARPICVN